MLIKNGLVALENSDEFQKLDIRVEGEKFTEFGENLSPKEGEEVLDASGKQILPGGIDPHVHFDEPGFESQEDFAHGSSAAISGGITTIIDMPCTSLPPVTSLANYKNKLGIVESKAVVDYGFFGGVSGNSLQEGFPKNMEELAPYVMGYKTYFVSGMETFKMVTPKDYPEILKTAKKLSRPVLLHAEDYEICSKLENKGDAPNTPKAFSASRPEEAEIEAVKTAVSIAKDVGADLHIVHVGTAKAVDYIKGDKISSETCPHYLAFDLDDFERIGSPLKICPPIKPNHNKDELWERLKNNEIDFMASDHAPSQKEQKYTDSIWDAYSGIPGCGTMYPFMYSKGFVEEKISLSQLTNLMSFNAAKRYGFDDRKGGIKEGKDADFVIINPEINHVIDGENLLSKGKVTPFDKMELNGVFEKTFIRGNLVHEYGKGVKVKGGFGKHILPK
jgi:allantoinase